MRIQCPSCGAEGRVPDQEGTRTVRCPQCEHLWEVGGDSGGESGGEMAGSRTGPAPRERRTVNRRGAPSGDFRVSKLVATGLSVWIRNLLPFGAIALVGYLPSLLYVLVLLSKGPTDREQLNTTPANVLSFFSTQFVAASVAAGVFQVLRQGKVEFGRSLKIGLNRLLPTMGIALAMGLALGLTAIPMLFLVSLLRNRAVDPCSGLFLLLLAIPVGYVFCGLCFAVPTTVVENKGVSASLSRSWRLTAGVRTRLLVGLVLLVLILSIPTGILGYVLEQAPLEIQVPAYEVLTILWLSVQGVMTCVGYHQLRVAREGIASEELAAIFD